MGLKCFLLNNTEDTCYFSGVYHIVTSVSLWYSFYFFNLNVCVAVSGILSRHSKWIEPHP